MLTLYDELYLLSIHEDKGTYLKSTADRIKPGLVGAILAELALLGKIQSSENHRLLVVEGSETEDELLNQVLAVLKETDKEHKFSYWINHLSEGLERIRRQMAERMTQQGVLYQDDDHLEWVIPAPLDPELNASSKFWLRQHIRNIVFTQEDVDQRDIALLSLIRACGLLDLIFLKDERRYASRHINEMMVSVAMNSPVAQTIEEIESAIAIVVEED
ncbi:MAG: GOLPH3/VPS74 family protein [Anaerolineales bacterium]